jgi:hypothetical protein
LSVFVIIVRDFIDNITTDFDLSAVINAMTRSASPSV